MDDIRQKKQVILDKLPGGHFDEAQCLILMLITEHLETIAEAARKWEAPGYTLATKDWPLMVDRLTSSDGTFCEPRSTTTPPE